MKYLLDIWRQKNQDSPGGFRTYCYETDTKGATVASALSELNERSPLTDKDGTPDERIVWECSCLQKKCGACAMLINGRPQLACQARLSEQKKGSIRLEPLHKFPLVADLMVNRDVIFEHLKEMQIWAKPESGITARDKDNAWLYEASRCLQCGCCLEVCPNFAADGRFFGMSAMVPTARLLTALDTASAKSLRQQYGRHIVDGCGKSLACQNICPAGINIEGLMVRSNAVLLWKHLLRVFSRSS